MKTRYLLQSLVALGKPIVLAGFAGAFCVGAFAQPAPADPAKAAKAPAVRIKLTSAGHLPPKHEYNVLHEKFLKTIEQRSDGQITIEHFPGGGLVAGRDMLEGLSNGIVDIAWVVTSQFPGDLPFVSAAGTLPNLWDFDLPSDPRISRGPSPRRRALPRREFLRTSQT